MLENGVGIVQQLRTLIENDECELALKTWSDFRRQSDQTCDSCSYKEIDKDDDCCMCLESKLRTLSLYEHGQIQYEKTLLHAARKISQFHQQAVSSGFRLSSLKTKNWFATP